jgi:hypothetical protein
MGGEGRGMNSSGWGGEGDEQQWVGRGGGRTAMGGEGRGMDGNGWGGEGDGR